MIFSLDFSALQAAPMIVQLHAGAATLAVALAPLVLLRHKGDTAHKVLGRLWVVAMALTALSSFGINQIRLLGAFSLIHMLSVLTLFSLVQAVRSARKRNIRAHQRHILGAAMGLAGAGLFTVFPGRLMSQVLFQGYEMEGFISSMALGGIAISALFMRRVTVRNSARG